MPLWRSLEVKYFWCTCVPSQPKHDPAPQQEHFGIWPACWQPSSLTRDSRHDRQSQERDLRDHPSSWYDVGSCKFHVFPWVKNLIESTNPNACCKCSRRRRVRTEQRKANRRCWMALKATLAEESCLTLFWDTLARHSCKTLFQDTLLGHSCLTRWLDTLNQYTETLL